MAILPATIFLKQRAHADKRIAFAPAPVILVMALCFFVTTTSTFAQRTGQLTQQVLTSSISGGGVIDTVPVMLSQFDAVNTGQEVSLHWTTTSETRNAGFDVEWARATGEFRSVGFVSGLGTTTESNDYEFAVSGLSPGTHAFRLRHVNYEGTSSYSPTVEVVVEQPVTHLVSTITESDHTNSEGMQMQLFVANGQNVKIDLLDIAGQRLVSVFDGRIAANNVKHVGLQGESLPNGRYVVRVVGESFRDSQVISIIN